MSGGLIDDLAQPMRVILTSSHKNEYSLRGSEIYSAFVYFLVDEGSRNWVPPEKADGAFARPSCDTNRDGWVSAEEAFRYARLQILWYLSHKVHPQMYDGYPGELKITKV